MFKLRIMTVAPLGFDDTSTCHSRESGNPYLDETKFLMTFKNWIPAFAGMTCEITRRIFKWCRYPNYKLRIVVISFAILFSLFDVASAQLRKTFTLPAEPKDTSTFWIFKDVTAGPYFTGGIARQNENLPNDWQSLPRFSYAIGATVDFFYNQWLGFDFSALYDSRDLYTDTAGESIDVSLGYLSFQPSIRLFWLLIGFSFDIPLEWQRDRKPFLVLSSERRSA